MSINVAIIGGGIWAREEHAPAVEAAATLTLKAVFSRSAKSAQSVADAVTSTVEVYSEEAGNTYEEIISKPDIHAIIVSLPINDQPPFIRKALLAGKHVLSEKPVAENMQAAHDLIKWYRTEIKGPTWVVGENYRFLHSYNYAAEQLKTMGRIISFHGLQHEFIPYDWKFNRTEWRRTAKHQGGYILDGGVHHMAGLRVLLDSQPGNNIARVSAFTSQQTDHLAPIDTVDVIMRTESGIAGSFQSSRATNMRRDEWTVACSQGWVRVRGPEVTVCRNGQGEETTKAANERSGVPTEVRAWGEALAEGKVRKEQEPEAALADLELIELLLKSGEQGGLPLSCACQNV